MSVLHFISSKEKEQQQILLTLHEYLIGHNGIDPKIKFKVPFYYRKSWICYLNPKGSIAVELVFLRGDELSNHNGLLDMRKRKQVAGVIYDKATDINFTTLDETFQEALILDDTFSYQSLRKRKQK